jgi:pentapeptide MXKDX repeat protein
MKKISRSLMLACIWAARLAAFAQTSMQQDSTAQDTMNQDTMKKTTP